MQELLRSDLSLGHRGILITLALVKDEDPELMWAKFEAKAKVNKETKELLIELHNKGLIEWSQVKRAINDLKKDRQTPQIVEIITFMNEVFGSSYKPTSKIISSAINARLQEYSVDDIKAVIANRWSVWKDDAVMSKYLTPDTIFRPSKFPKYFEEAKRTSIGKGMINAMKFDLKKGDQITFEHIEQLIDNDTYDVKCCSYNQDGVLISIGSRLETLYGKNLKRNIAIAHDAEKRGFKPEFGYIYWPINHA